MKSILALIEGSGADAAILEAAHILAKAVNGHIDVLHVDLTALEARRTESAEAARAAFVTLCARQGVTEVNEPSAARGVTIRWHREGSGEVERLIETARHHDLIICGHPSSGHAWPRQLIERLLTETGRPLLLLPKDVRLRDIDNVTLCWKEDAASARALSAALPLLRQAKNVTVVTVHESRDQNAKSGQDLAAQLGWQGIDARAELIWDGGASAITHIRAAAAANRASLIVMGAFSHTRHRERLFGGFTQAMLDAAERPVLLLH